MTPRTLQTTLRLSLALLILATWAIVWQARIIQGQKHLIREMSGFTFKD